MQKPLKTHELKRGEPYQVLVNRDFFDEWQCVEFQKGQVFDAIFIRASQTDPHCGLFKVNDDIVWLPVETPNDREVFVKVFGKVS